MVKVLPVLWLVVDTWHLTKMF